MLAESCEVWGRRVEQWAERVREPAGLLRARGLPLSSCGQSLHSPLSV